jgi:hypothetical protein
MMLRTFGALVVSLLLVSCGGDQTEDSDSVEAIQESLELEQAGGFDMLDELPLFDMPELNKVPLQPTLTVPELPSDLNELAGIMPADGSLPQPPPPPPCPHGLLAGAWKHIKNGFGVFYGKWAAPDGTLVGHLKGIYGKNLKGENVLFGKVIALDGKFIGVIKGRYGMGFFKAALFDPNGMKGELMGAYGKAKCVPDASTGAAKCLPGAGHFVGKWRLFCPLCKMMCTPGFVPAPDGKCICVPVQVIPCQMGQCPQGMFCDLCPPLPGCTPDQPCIALCAPPVCRHLPPPPGSGSQDPNAPAPNSGDPNSAGAGADDSAGVGSNLQ